MNREDVEKLFAYAHLPERLKAVSRPFYDQAMSIAAAPPSPWRYLALIKLLEAKDAVVRFSVHEEVGP